MAERPGSWRSRRRWASDCWVPRRSSERPHRQQVKQEVEMDWKMLGAFAFGLVIGWYVYYVNRYRKGDVQIGDITTIIGAIGGGAVLALFEPRSELFGAYALGLAVGFFLYFLVLIILVGVSENFDSDWFLDGRRKDPPVGYGFGHDRGSGVGLAPPPAMAAPIPAPLAAPLFARTMATPPQAVDDPAHPG